MSIAHVLTYHRPRPHLIDLLYGARPNQCSTCGRRFLATDGDRKKKARHLDWHFRTNQRLADSARRGQSRSWYVDEMVSKSVFLLSEPKYSLVRRSGSSRRTMSEQMQMMHQLARMLLKLRLRWPLRRMILRPNTSPFLASLFCPMHPVPYARRDSRQSSTTRHKTSYGWTRLKSEVGCSMLAVMQK